MDRRALLTIATIVACKQHHEAAPSSTETTAPLSSSSAVALDDPLGGVLSAAPSGSMDSHAFGDAGAAVDLARQAALQDAREFGRIDGGAGSIFSTKTGGIAALFPPDGGDPFGAGGLDLQALAGSGGTGIGTIGTGGMSHRGAATSSVRLGTLTVVGSLAPEVVRRIVRRHFGRFRLCYENGLRSNPALEGVVSTKIVIAKDGSVSSARDGGSDLPDASVVQCVVRGFSSLVFPQPEGGGIVLVTAPLRFSPTSR